MYSSCFGKRERVGVRGDDDDGHLSCLTTGGASGANPWGARRSHPRSLCMCVKSRGEGTLYSAAYL